MPCQLFLPVAAIREHAARQCGQPERVVQFAISEQPRVGGHPRSVELQFQAAVEKGPEWPMIRFTPPGSASELPSDTLKPVILIAEIVPIRHQAKRSLGKCGSICMPVLKANSASVCSLTSMCNLLIRDTPPVGDGMFSICSV